MKQGIFEKEIFILADVKTVIDIISDYSQHHKIHPLIVKVERDQKEPQGIRRYYITDSLKWGIFKFKIRYRADIISITKNAIHTEAYQSPSTYITNVTKVTPQENGACLYETITLQAPNLLFRYAFQQAVSAHDEMLKRIKIFIETKQQSH